MARPLRKYDKMGALYTRPAAIEVKIDAALKQDLATLQRRIAITDRNLPDYLPSECLVHLIRDGKRRDDHALMRVLLRVLMTRCEANLLRKIPDGELPNAVDLREEVVSQLGELFAIDGSGKNPDELDYFECRFNLAFQSLRVDIVRSAVAGQRATVSLSEVPDDGEESEYDDKLFARISEALRTPATQEGNMQLGELLETINSLPPEERQAVMLCHVLGYDEESDDPDKTTAATLAGVTGRTIRNRLSRAAKKLSKFKEDL